MAKAKRKISKKQPNELDGVYFLKLVLYMIVGSQWVFLTDQAVTKRVPLPLGLAIGGFFAVHEHFQIDRKIEYALLLVACFVGFLIQMGVTIVSL